MFNKKNALYLLSILVVFLIQQILILRLDARLNFWPTLLIFSLLIFDLRKALIWALSIAWLLDLYSFLPFGSYLFYFFIIMLILYFLTKNFLTNRSLVSLLILDLLSCGLFLLLLFISEQIYLKFLLINKIALYGFKNALIFLGANLLLTLILFIITLKFTKILEVNSLSKK